MANRLEEFTRALERAEWDDENEKAILFGCGRGGQSLVVWYTQQAVTRSMSNTRATEIEDALSARYPVRS